MLLVLSVTAQTWEVEAHDTCVVGCAFGGVLAGNAAIGAS